MRVLGVALLVAALAVPVLAAPPPLPRPKPKLPDAAQTVPVPKPRPKPPLARRGADPAPMPPMAVPPAQEGPPQPGPEQASLPRAQPVPLPGRDEWSAATIAAGREACRAQLKGLDIEWAEAPAMGHAHGCGAPAPILVSRVAGLAIEPPALTSCGMAAGLHQWITQSVKPAAGDRLKQKITGLRNATAYACRGRNGARAGKLSQHAYANALDVSAFLLADGTAVTVKDDWGVGLMGRSAFLRAAHSGLCPIFTTVLGPGSDGYHEDHFHLDMTVRRGGYRICQ
jgi:hypothetical protein